MTGIDDRLERDLERAARPAAPDPGGTLEDVRRRRARRSLVRKTQTIGLVVVVLVGTAAGFAVLQRNFTGADQPESSGSTSTPSPSTAAPAFAPIAIPADPTKVFDIGLSFPVCRGSMIQGNFLGTDPTYAYVFTKASDGGCDTDTTVVVVQVPSDAAGTSITLAVGGPLDCQDPSTCFVWANPDIDGNGRDEVAIITGDGADGMRFELYVASHSSEGWALLPFTDPQGMPSTFPYDMSSNSAGAYCDDTSGERRFISWRATTTDGSTYDVTRTPYALNDVGTLQAHTDTTETVAADAPPPTGFAGCGGTIQNPVTP